MSILALILPLVIILIIGTSIIGKLTKHFKLSKRPTKKIILIYIALLIVALAIYPALTSSNTLRITDEEIQQQIKINKTFEQNALVNKLTEDDAKFLVDEWIYTLKGEELYLKQVSPDEYIEKQVIVHWTDAKNQQIEGKVYSTRSILYNMDLTEEIEPTLINWTDHHTLTFQKPENRIEGNIFTDEIVFFPFNKDYISLNANEEVEAQGSTYVVLKVPKHINVQDENGLRMYPPVE
ncbi:hypothetical protein JFL43_13830 [Viridibacillus sp. YIM B01967]|uniref:Uncharacterized protein n=1 Tax=Viridibacillus soli TaxID=2798301 RepID=A0ABS1H921_9BACL|nr:hypothetical protein [Viridibacillus soli]MBK3495920.1 hypothetical protein [Viridibacillus soli]